MLASKNQYRATLGRWVLAGTVGVFTAAALNVATGCATSGPPKPTSGPTNRISTTQHTPFTSADAFLTDAPRTSTHYLFGGYTEADAAV